MAPQFYLFLFMMQATMASFSTIFFNKKYQANAGVSLSSNVVFLWINGVVSAMVSAVFLLLMRTPLDFTLFSVLMATAIVGSSACAVAVTMNAYSCGSIAIVNVISTVGSILLSCLWGIVKMGDRPQPITYLGVVLMIAASVLMLSGGKAKVSKKFLILCVLAALFNTITGVLSKEHQVAEAFAKVDTYSFSFWVGAMRGALFTLIFPFVLLIKKPKSFVKPGKFSYLAVIASVISGSAYVVNLFVNAQKDIGLSTITPFGTGVGILLAAIIPFLFFKERFSKRQIIGLVCSFFGVLIYLFFPST